MNEKLLFDVAPTEQNHDKRAHTRNKRARAQNDAAHTLAVEKPEKTPYYIGNSPQRAILPIGRLDDLVECVDSRCRTACHDILTEDCGEWLLQCNYCNCTQWVKAIPGHLEPRDEFVFRDGRFAGLSIDQAAAEQHGMDYLKWAAKSHKRDAVKLAVKKWLDQKSASL